MEQLLWKCTSTIHDFDPPPLSLFFLTFPFLSRCLHVSVCSLGCCSSMIQTSWLTHAGRSPTCLTAPMTRSRPSSTQESAAGWWSCCCKATHYHFYHF